MPIPLLGLQRGLNNYLQEMAQPGVTNPTQVCFLVGALHSASINSQDFITSMFTKGRRTGTGTVDQAVPQIFCLSPA